MALYDISKLADELIKKVHTDKNSKIANSIDTNKQESCQDKKEIAVKKENAAKMEKKAFVCEIANNLKKVASEIRQAAKENMGISYKDVEDYLKKFK